MKGRILGHWSRKKECNRLLYGGVETSILSIDVFGALDTTRIFVKQFRRFQDIDAAEKKYEEEFDARYKLNRAAGGLNAEEDDSLRIMQLLNTRRTRKLSSKSEE